MDDELGKAGVEGEQMNVWGGIPRSQRPPARGLHRNWATRNKTKSTAICKQQHKSLYMFLSQVPYEFLSPAPIPAVFFSENKARLFAAASK